MLALQAVNNETGVIQPVAEAAALIHAANGVVVCDAVQAVGRLETTFATTDADILFFSSHKLGGPMGVGALAFRDESLHLAAPMLRGGGQEFGRRAGTENVAGIAGFATALTAATADLEGRAVAARRFARRFGAESLENRARRPILRFKGAARAKRQRFCNSRPRTAHHADGARP